MSILFVAVLITYNLNIVIGTNNTIFSTTTQSIIKTTEFFTTENPNEIITTQAYNGNYTNEYDYDYEYDDMDYLDTSMRELMPYFVCLIVFITLCCCICLPWVCAKTNVYEMGVYGAEHVDGIYDHHLPNYDNCEDEAMNTIPADATGYDENKAAPCDQNYIYHVPSFSGMTIFITTQIMHKYVYI